MRSLFGGRWFVFPRVMFCGWDSLKKFRDGLNFAHPSQPSKSVLDSPSSEVRQPAGRAALADICSLVVGLLGC